MKRLNGAPFEYQFLRAEQMVPGNRFGAIAYVGSNEAWGATDRFIYLGGRAFGEAKGNQKPDGKAIHAYPLDELIGICLDGETR